MNTGRNDPCPCGSGRKFKHCHGAATSAPAKARPVDGKSRLARAAAELHAGRLDAAAERLDQVLRADPRDQDALLLRSGVAFRQRDYLLSSALLTRLIDLRPQFAQAHFNLALCLDALGRKAEAEARYREAIRLQPTFVDACANLGNLLRSLGRLEEAEALHRRVADHTPGSAHAWLNLASSLKEQGRLGEAEAACRQALRQRRELPEAQNNLGNVLVAAGRLDEAISAFQAALRGRPADAEIECNLAFALKLAGRVGEAVVHARTGFRLRRDRRAAAMLMDCVRVARFDATTPDLEADLAALLELPSVDPGDLVPAAASALRVHAGLAPLFAVAGAAQTCNQSFGAILAANAGQLAHPLLLALMSVEVVFDPHFEALFTKARSACLLDPALGKQLPLAFLIALAHQFFLVEYVYEETPEEQRAVAALASGIHDALQTECCPAPEAVALLACYRALGREAFATGLRECEGLGAIDAVVARQVVDPLEEAQLAAALPSLSQVEDAVSRQVRSQYEENPYPRWRKTGIPESLPFERAVRQLFPAAAIGPAVDVRTPRVLVAGCGTGKHAILSATRYLGARVTAVDLSRTSLAYGARQSRALGIANIEFVHADILDLGRLEAGFDLVESFGVLHHMRDPMAGWRVLADLLKPGGLMMVGLYSEIARAPVVTARRLIAERGYPPTVEGIRRFRAELPNHGNATLRTALAQSIDFYSTSGCRDLLFHVEEHRYTVAQIDASVRALGFEFIGFELHDATVLAAYRTRFPDDPSLASLANWDAFERDHPATFAESYKFWLRKPLAPPPRVAPSAC